jgi:hypothetical protein
VDTFIQVRRNEGRDFNLCKRIELPNRERVEVDLNTGKVILWPCENGKATHIEKSDWDRWLDDKKKAQAR